MRDRDRVGGPRRIGTGGRGVEGRKVDPASGTSDPDSDSRPKGSTVRVIEALSLVALVGSAAVAQPIHFEEDLVLDPTGTEAEFGRISDVAVAPDGTVFVADWGFHRIHVFDDEGTHRTSFGQVGEAPGDLPSFLVVLGIDPEGTLVVGGQRPFLAWLDAEGEPIRTVNRGDGGHQTRDLAFAHDGRIALSYAYLDHAQTDVVPTMLHVLGPDGAHQGSYAEATFWTDDLRPIWAQSIAIARVAAVDGGTGWWVVQSQPFVLRRFDLDGREIARTSEGAGDFVHGFSPPEVDGDTTTMRFTAGAGKPLVTSKGTVLIHAWHTHPEDLDLDDPNAPRRTQTRVFVYDTDLVLRGTVDAPGWFYAMDDRDRIWCVPDGLDVPHLVRYRVVAAD